MRALGIPNNKNFYEVTQIAEAKALWVNIQVRCCSCSLDRCSARSLDPCCACWAEAMVLQSANCV